VADAELVPESDPLALDASPLPVAVAALLPSASVPDVDPVPVAAVESVAVEDVSLPVLVSVEPASLPDVAAVLSEVVAVPAFDGVSS
jgi:hypothetical protein